MQSRALQIASSFTSRPIAHTLRPLLMNANIAEELSFAEYSQATEYMLVSAVNHAQIIGTVVLVRVEDWLRPSLGAARGDGDPEISQKFRDRLATGTDEFAQQLGLLSASGKPVWLLVCPSNGWIAQSHKLEALCRTYTNLLLARARSLQITLLKWPASLSNDVLNDGNADRLGQMPFTRAGFEQLGLYLGEQVEHSLVRDCESSAAATGEGARDLAAYLGGLRVHVRLNRAQPCDHNDVDKLLRTAAAFSLSGERRDLGAAEVEEVIESGGCILVDVSDRLANYGNSGIVAYQCRNDSLLVHIWALSCPVLGKQVEWAVLSGLAQVAASQNCARLVFDYRASERNHPMLNFLQSVADSESGMRFALPLSSAEPRIQDNAVAPGTWTVDCETNLLCSKAGE